MNEPKSSWTKDCDLGRREACKKMPCAAVGALAAAGLMGGVPVAGKGEPAPGRKISMEENPVARIVKVRVISQKGTCSLGHRIGDTITFAEKGIDGQMCIHALYAVLPKVFAMMFDARFPWLENPDVATSACPDAANPVVFEVSRSAPRPAEHP